MSFQLMLWMCLLSRPVPLFVGITRRPWGGQDSPEEARATKNKTVSPASFKKTLGRCIHFSLTPFSRNLIRTDHLPFHPLSQCLIFLLTSATLMSSCCLHCPRLALQVALTWTSNCNWCQLSQRLSHRLSHCRGNLSWACVKLKLSIMLSMGPLFKGSAAKAGMVASTNDVF